MIRAAVYGSQHMSVFGAMGDLQATDSTRLLRYTKPAQERPYERQHRKQNDESLFKETEDMNGSCSVARACKTTRCPNTPRIVAISAGLAKADGKRH
jgi:hypothetical protein